MDQSPSTTENSSPLETSQPDSISELFARDPTEWTDADMERMIDHYRKMRLTIGENQAPVKQAKAPKIPVEDFTSKSTEDVLKALGLE